MVQITHNDQVTGLEEQKDLIVLFHAMGGSEKQLQHLKAAVLEAWEQRKAPAPIVFIPDLPIGTLSFADPCDIALSVMEQIDSIWQNSEHGFSGIYLVGHSMGALLARKVYVCACGETLEAPFEPQLRDSVKRTWASHVKRVVLFAATNRGWRLTPHLSISNFLRWGAGVVLGNTVMAITLGRLTPLAFTTHHGAPFLTQLRLQWMAMRRQAKSESTTSAITVQLLGSTDDLVSPEDNIDLVAGDDFYYLDVPKSGHVNVVDADDTAAGHLRRQVIIKAINSSPQELSDLSILPTDQDLPKPDNTITDVVFVIHGIRDQGYWTQKIARRIVALARQRNKITDRHIAADIVGPTPQKQIIKTETSSYGYFAMLPFLLPNIRRKRVEWLMDRYAENKAVYPNAAFSYVGHSHGTYMLAKALSTYSCLRFKHIAFAGSVVNVNYDWKTLTGLGRVKGVVNFVASADWVVAIFPRTFQMLRLQDLGSAGHDGFEQENKELFESEYVKGGHSAALREENWDVIASFILDGNKPSEPDLAHERASWTVELGHYAPQLMLLVLFLVALGGYLLLAPLLAMDRGQWYSMIAFMLYVLGVWKVLTWL
ncbi:alpha/beta fold hydrolase [Pseudomonas sp. B21-048]|uniref:alpha/beta fold hydrolase n=1 Tax=Pseudomonas sp. B21-048 TaxID=2895490 RepID=UPI00215E6B78|nr:alpha/beta hydrolase [Pseudomonas sp. B21-048]UVK96999.1 alpha/beta hydrolase [Pseudomonas sp. B21-048]